MNESNFGTRYRDPMSVQSGARKAIEDVARLMRPYSEAQKQIERVMGSMYPYARNPHMHPALVAHRRSMESMERVFGMHLGAVDSMRRAQRAIMGSRSMQPKLGPLLEHLSRMPTVPPKFDVTTNARAEAVPIDASSKRSAKAISEERESDDDEGVVWKTLPPDPNFGIRKKRWD